MSRSTRQPPASGRQASPSRPAGKGALRQSRAPEGDEGSRLAGTSDDLKRSLAAQAYSHSIIDTVREPLVVLDEQLRIISANRSFYATFALDPADAVGRHLAGAHGQGLDSPLLEAFLARITAGDDLIEDHEIVVDLPSVGGRTLLLNGRKIGTLPHGDRKILVAIEDVTERKRASAALQAAKATAEQANRAKSRFLAAASHDLRQPLQTMSLLHGVLRRLVKDGQVSALADKLDDTLAVMTRMLNALLDINQIEAGVVRAEIRDFAIADVIELLQAEFSYHTAGKALGWRVVPSTAIVRSDRVLLEGILRNLLSNAVKYTEKGRILFGCRRLGGKLRVEVWDTGTGIGDEHLETIFEEFHQIGNAARERSAGLGLGLFIARRLGALLGLRISVRSRLGAGSVFSVEVPTASDDARLLAITDTDQAAPGRSGGTILIVEDDTATRDMLALLFDLDGYVTVAARDALDARTMIERRGIRPDVVLADYNLPGGMTGLDLAKALRVRLGSDLPVVILTGDISSDGLRKIADAGCLQLVKPIKATELSRLVASLLPAAQPIENAAASDEDGTVFVIDDDPALREALTSLLEADGRRVESFGGAEQFLATYRASSKGCLLIDLRLPGMSGLALLEQLNAAGETLPAIMITGHGDVPSAIRAMEAGAAGFIEKPVSPPILLRAIARAIAEGRDLAEASARREDAGSRIAGLTPRERQVMAMVVAGSANKEIAYRLGIHQRTVENHRATLMKKTGTSSLAELIHLDLAARGMGARAAGRPPE